MHDDKLMEQVRELRARGFPPKVIARALGARPAVVAPLVRAIASEASTEAAEPALVGCWVSQGWDEGLGVKGHPEWPGRHTFRPERCGLVSVLVAREHRRFDKVSVCGYLVDAYCLGVKDAIGPRAMPRGDLPAFVARYFEAYDDPPVAAPIGLAQHLVFGAVEYARGLGLEPHRDFGRAVGHLGSAPVTNAIRFGYGGQPYYVAGPYDDTRRILRTLEASVGIDNLQFIVPAEAFA